MRAAAVFALALFSGHVLGAETPYRDDRSSAVAVVQSLYNAITRHEYARAWSYFGEVKPASDFDAFVAGYEDTERVEVRTGAIASEGAAGSVYFTVPVAIRATAGDGSETVYAGCYTLRQVNPQIQEPPFKPIQIERGTLEPSTASFADALPQDCGA